jgi:hypothetical protein
MSFTPDGQVHEYASPGTDDLTEEDRLYSSLPYGNKALYVDAFFGNVANLDNGRTWSTPWVIDDPAVYVIPPQGQTVRNLTSGGGQTTSRGGESPSVVNRLFGTWRR